MKQINLNILSFSLLLTILAQSCVTNNEDAPPIIPFESGIPKTIDYVKEMYADELKKHFSDREPILIEDNISIKAVVTADDKTTGGNFYKVAYIKDNSSAVQLLFQSTGGLKINDSIVLNLKGLYLFDYHDLIQIGHEPYQHVSSTSGNVSLRLGGIDKHKYLIKSHNDELRVHPIPVGMEDLNDDFLSQLVKIDNVQFISSDRGKYFANKDDTKNTGTDRTLENCAGNTMVVRTSNYSVYTNTVVPDLNGSITGIVTKYKTSYQLNFRIPEDLDFTNDLCN